MRLTPIIVLVDGDTLRELDARVEASVARVRKSVPLMKWLGEMGWEPEYVSRGILVKAMLGVTEVVSP